MTSIPEEAARHAAGAPSRLAAEIAALAGASAHDLRIEWRRHYRVAPPARLSRDLLLRGVLYKVQERALGGLGGGARRQLRLLVQRLANEGAGGPAPVPTLRPGTRLVREWRGQSHSILVHPQGFEYDGQRYRSLTQIARQITGAHWSGPRFFGLTTAARDEAGDAP